MIRKTGKNRRCPCNDESLHNSSENSISKLKGIHAEKIGGIAGELQDLRSALPDIDKMKIGFDRSSLQKG